MTLMVMVSDGKFHISKEIREKIGLVKHGKVEVIAKKGEVTLKIPRDLLDKNNPQVSF